jgi:hypothetical protein
MGSVSFANDKWNLISRVSADLPTCDSTRCLLLSVCHHRCSEKLACLALSKGIMLFKQRMDLILDLKRFEQLERSFRHQVNWDIQYLEGEHRFPRLGMAAFSSSR